MVTHVSLDSKLAAEALKVSGERTMRAAVLEGRGVIAGTAVRCAEPSFMLKFKTNYPPREIDRVDVRALCTHLGVTIPDSPR